MLIDPTYFIGEISIPNTEEAAVAENVNLFIQKYEDKLLYDVLGISLYEGFKTGIAQQPPDQKWIDLRDGKSYTNIYGKTARWKGLINSDTKQSLIANYIYWYYMNDKGSWTTGSGEMQTNEVSPASKMVRAWNEFVQWLKELVCFLDANKTTYTEWSDVSHCIISNGVVYYGDNVKHFLTTNIYGI